MTGGPIATVAAGGSAHGDSMAFEILNITRSSLSLVRNAQYQVEDDRTAMQTAGIEMWAFL